jgi:hypothetical protein
MNVTRKATRQINAGSRARAEEDVVKAEVAVGRRFNGNCNNYRKAGHKPANCWDKADIAEK